MLSDDSVILRDFNVDGELTKMRKLAIIAEVDFPTFSHVTPTISDAILRFPTDTLTRYRENPTEHFDIFRHFSTKFYKILRHFKTEFNS